MNWFPEKRNGLLCGAAIFAVLLTADGLVFHSLLRAPINLWTYARALLSLAILLLAIAVGYAWYGLLNLAYHSGRNGIVIRWAACFDVIPAADIKRVVTLPRVRVRGGLGWPGYRFGRAFVLGVGRARVYLSGPFREAVVVETRQGDWVISPADCEGFLVDTRARSALGPAVAWTQGLRRPEFLNLGLWHDRLARALAALALLLAVGLAGFLAARYPQLPGSLILSLGSQGLGDHIGARSQLFLWPGVGLAVLLVNATLAAWVHRRERLLALLLLGTALLVQALAWLAAVHLVG